MQIDGTSIPITTKRLEWRGEIVAVPMKEDARSGTASAAQLRKWAKMKGAARVVKTFPIDFDAVKYAVPQFSVEPVDASDASHGGDTCVVVQVRDEARTVCRRLVAFDGKTRRVLWDDNSDGFNPYWRGRQGDNLFHLHRDTHLFRLRDVPLAWGEITFREDIVFTRRTPQQIEQTADLKTIGALERAGGLRFRRQVVVRAQGKKVTAPVFQKTPNIQLEGVKVQRDAIEAHLLVALKYVGPRANPELDVPGYIDISDAEEKVSGDFVKSCSINRAGGAGEWVLKIDFKDIQKAPRKLRLDTEVVDNDAAPLHVRTEFVLPRDEKEPQGERNRKEFQPPIN